MSQVQEVECVVRASDTEEDVVVCLMIYNSDVIRGFLKRLIVVLSSQQQRSQETVICVAILTDLKVPTITFLHFDTQD